MMRSLLTRERQATIDHANDGLRMSQSRDPRMQAGAAMSIASSLSQTAALICERDDARADAESLRAIVAQLEARIYELTAQLSESARTKTALTWQAGTSKERAKHLRDTLSEEQRRLDETSEELAREMRMRELQERHTVTACACACSRCM